MSLMPQRDAETPSQAESLFVRPTTPRSGGTLRGISYSVTEAAASVRHELIGFPQMLMTLVRS